MLKTKQNLAGFSVSSVCVSMGHPWHVIYSQHSEDPPLLCTSSTSCVNPVFTLLPFRSILSFLSRLLLQSGNIWEEKQNYQHLESANLWNTSSLKAKDWMNNVSATPVPPWTNLFLLDYWVNWGPLCTKSQLTFGAISQFIHLPCVIEERHNPFLNHQHRYLLLQPTTV